MEDRFCEGLKAGYLDSADLLVILRTSLPSDLSPQERENTAAMFLQIEQGLRIKAASVDLMLMEATRA